jgi:hypothetical protein
MVIHNFHVVRLAGAPSETDSPLAVDADAVLPRAIPMQCFQPVGRWNPQGIQIRSRINHPEFPHGQPLYFLRQLPRKLAMKDPFSFFAPESLDHG